MEAEISTKIFAYAKEIFVTLPVLTLTLAALPLTLAATTVSDVSFAAKAHSVMPVLTDRSRLLPENTLI